MTLKEFREAFPQGQVVKPVLTVLGFTVASWAVLYNLVLPEWYRTLVSLMVGYWFGSQTTRSRNGEGKG